MCIALGSLGSLEDAFHEAEIHAADEICVVLDEGMKRAVPQCDLVVRAVWFKAAPFEHGEQYLVVDCGPILATLCRRPQTQTKFLRPPVQFMLR